MNINTLSGGNVKRPFFLSALTGVALFITGCSTFDRSDSEWDGPRIFLAGAQVRQAKSLAMGSAATKGWKIEDASGAEISLRRPLALTDAEVLVGAPVTAASVAVKTRFDQHRTGVGVVTKAAVIADTITAKGKSVETNIDVTNNYHNDLSLSLAALQRSWQQAGHRIVAAHQPPPPPPPTKDAEPEDTDAANRPDATTEEEGTEGEETADAAASPPPETEPEPETETGAPTAAPNAVAPPAAPADAQAEPVAPAVRITDRAPPPPSPVIPPPGAPATALLTPNPPRETGTWVYYAEHAAKAQGCEPLPGGIVPETRQAEFELYRVRCSNGYSLFLRCNAGVCNVLKEN